MVGGVPSRSILSPRRSCPWPGPGPALPGRQQGDRGRRLFALKPLRSWASHPGPRGSSPPAARPEPGRPARPGVRCRWRRPRLNPIQAGSSHGREASHRHRGSWVARSSRRTAVVFAVEAGANPVGLALSSTWGSQRPWAIRLRLQRLEDGSTKRKFIGQGSGWFPEKRQRRSSQGGGGRIPATALTSPGQPHPHIFGDRFAGLQRQATPAAHLGLLPAPCALATARQAQAAEGRPEPIFGPQVPLIQPGAEVVLVEAEAGGRRGALNRRRVGHPPGIRAAERSGGDRHAAAIGWGARVRARRLIAEARPR